MKIKLHHMLIPAVLMFIMIRSPLVAAQDGPSEHELAVIAYINQARQAPLAMAESMGMDPDRILDDFPEWNEMLQEGMPPVNLDERLYASASGHVEDMLANNYYSRVSPDGMTWEDRIIAAGYPLITCGETIGMLGFVNFINPDDAALKLFEKMYEHELDPTWTGQRNILNPDLREVGVSLMAGVYSISGSPWNVYIATCDYGISEEYAVGLGIMRLINQLRADPLSFIQASGIDETTLAQTLADQGEIIPEGSLPALAWNESLYEAAGGHGEKMMQEGRLHRILSDGSGPADRIEAAGYEAVRVDEAIAVVHIDDQGSPLEQARHIFDQILLYPVDSANPDIVRFLSVDFREIGVHVRKGVLDQGEGNTPIEYFMVTINLAEPLEPENFLIGNIYFDLDGSYDLDDGEEASPGQIYFKSMDGLWNIKACTGPLGFYQVRLPMGFLKVEFTTRGADPLSLGLFTFLGPGRNTMKDFRFMDDRL
ncbi:MAG: hypothetical protein GY864_00290 [Desulfobacterales bacterium]|nr:hypothetical protein [Desulfobacterales bacterium]